ncbi:ATP-binding protein [Brevibacillus sp. H7]|uniref:ATP-binding protein n=1 Tax=Brevibacillus sp. H7 TaxID=3349138 RepID=UPI003826D134
MKIEEVQLKGFGKWQDAVFPFSPGLNLISAPNEAGKSTLLQGLFAALYGLKRDYVRSARYLPEYEKYMPWHQGPYETIVQYQLAGKSYRLHRHLEKERESARLYLNPDWEDVTHLYQEDRRRERNFLELHLGLNRSLFTDITWVKREPLIAAEYLLPSLSRVEETDPEVNRMLAGLERDITAIGKKERAENTLLGKAAGLVALKKQEWEAAERGWQAAQQLTRQIVEWEAEQARWQKEWAAHSRRLEQLADAERKWQQKWTDSYQLKHSDQLKAWEKQSASEAERNLHQTTRRALAEQENAACGEELDLAQQERLERLEEAYSRGWQLLKERENKREQLRQLVVDITAAGPQRQRRGQVKASSESGKRTKKGRIGVAAAVLLTVAAAVLIAADREMVGLAAGGIAAVSLGILWFLQRQRESGIAPSASRDDRMRSLEEEDARLNSEMQSILAEWGVSDWEGFLAIREELIKSGHRATERKWTAQMRRQEEREQIIARWGEEVRRLLKQEKEQLDEQRMDLTERQREAADRIQSCREQIARATGEIGKHDHAFVAKARGEYDDAVSALQHLQRRREALVLARDTLQEAMTEWNRDISPAVNRLASEVMSQITKGVYRDVRLDPRRQFSVRVLEPVGQLVVEHDQCSTGTQDQLYFAQRIALLRHVSGQTEPLPLFLDDHFVHYDEERLERTLDYLLELSKEHQVFLFSCQQRELAYLEPYLMQSERHGIHRL